MHRFFQSLRPLIRWVVAHPVIILVVALVFTFVGGRLASRLTIDTDLANLIPSDYPSVIALEKLRETVGGEQEAALAITSPSFEANKTFAEALLPEVLAMKGDRYDEPYFSRADYRKDVTFLKNNALYFATDAELDLLENWLDDRIEDARLEANPFFFDLGDDGEEAEPDSVAEELRLVYDSIVSREYPISEDSTTLVLRFFPTGSVTNIRFIEDAYRDLDALVVRMQPTSFHPDMDITVAGRLQRRLVEVKAIEKDVLGSFGVGVSTVLLIVVLYFAYKAYRARAGRRFVWRILLAETARIPVMAVLIGVPLLMSLAWTFGLAELRYGSLNLMTSALGLVLFGLGIDFGIHFYARYSEERAHGATVEEAAEVTFTGTGQAITVGALTTAMALYVLTIADFKGFSQFGFQAGTGILLALVAMLIVLPALLSLFERLRLLNLQRSEHTETEPARAERDRFPAVRTVLALSIILVVIALVAMPRIGFEYEFGKLEPEYAEYNARRDVISRVGNAVRGRNPAYIVVDDPAEVDPVVAALRMSAAADTLSPTILRIESLQERFPMDSDSQVRRLARIAAVRERLDDPFLSGEESEELDRLRAAAGSAEPIAMDDVPDFLRREFTSKTGELGQFIIIYPSVGLSDGLMSIAFAEDVGTVTTADGRVYHAGSTSLVAADMLQLMQSEAPWMVLATLLIVVVLMLINFGSVRWAFLALLPLMVGLLWMLLMIEIFGLRLNFYNLIVLPAVLGIGNDAGVHIVHRYREMGAGSVLKVIRTTGEHVTMGSLTTMVGFAGLLLSFHPGLESIGHLAVAGIGSTLVAALVFLPALLQVQEDRSRGSGKKA